jgi:hypothetical protein
LPQVLRFCERPVFPHSALSCVVPLPSSGVTRLRWYYWAIRLPTPHLPFSLFGCPAYSPCREEGARSPRLPHNHNVRHAMVSDPEEASISLPVSSMLVLTSGSTTPSSFPTSHLRSFPSTFRLTACLLAILRLKLNVTTQPPRTRYPVAGKPSGAGFAPARLCDLARPHCSPDTGRFRINIDSPRSLIHSLLPVSRSALLMHGRQNVYPISFIQINKYVWKTIKQPAPRV